MGTQRDGKRRARRCTASSYGYRRDLLDHRLELDRLKNNRMFDRVMRFLMEQLEPGYGCRAVGLRELWQKSSLIHKCAPSTLDRWCRWAAERGHLNRKYDGKHLWYFMPEATDERWMFWRKLAKDLVAEYLIRPYIPKQLRPRRTTPRLPGRRGYRPSSPGKTAG